MTSFSSCCVSCPDCGLRFPHPEDPVSASNVSSECFTCRGRSPPLAPPPCDCQECRIGKYSEYSKENLNISMNPPVFKKPLLTTLMSSIWNPFKGSDINVNVQGHQKQTNQLQSQHRRPMMRAPAPRQHQGLRPPSDNGSMVSRTSSWVTGLFNWNWNNSPSDFSNRFWRKRKMPAQMEDFEYSDEDDSQMVPEFGKKKWDRSAGQFCQNQAGQLERRIIRTREHQEQYETSYYSSESDTDRLNLQQFLLLPPLTKHERIQNWLDKLQINMQNISSCKDSCVSACECKKRKFEQKEKLIMSYMIKSGEETQKLQKTLAEHEDIKEKEFQLLTSLSKANEDVKAEISDCVKTQRNILEKFLHESSRLDLEFDVEERMNAAQAEESLRAIQDKLCADIVRKESHSMIRLFSS